MAAPNPNLEWLGHVQPTGLVVAPAVLARHGLVPEEQLRTDGDATAEHLASGDEGPALLNPWPFFAEILGWDARFVAGAPGGPDLPDELSATLPEADTTLAPTWAVGEPDGGWQMLVSVEGPGVDPDARGALAGWEATPHQRLERLLRETGVPTGILLTDRHLRLIHAPRGETSGWLAFPLRELGTVGGRPMLGGLKLLLNAHRLFTDGADRRLPGLLRASREAQAEVSAKLATQVLGALHELLRGLHAADRERVERLARQQPAQLYEGLLTVLLRLIFLLYAEDRNLIPSRADGPARALYQEGYGVRTLHAKLLADRARHPDTMEERRGAWGRLLALFRLVHGGDGTGWIRGRGGKLFDPSAFLFLEGRAAADDRPVPPGVTDGCVLRVLDGLLVLDGEKLSYRTLDVEQIGSVYETVMGFTVQAMTGSALAIKAGKNNRTPVFVDLAALAAKRGKDREKHLKEEADRGQLPARVVAALSAATDAAALAEALRRIVDERGSPHGPVPQGTPLLQPTDERRRTGSHYTPRSLTEPIVRHALEPAFARIGPDATPGDVLALKVCDPAMGSGAFLVEACRQIATRLVASWARHPGTRPPIAEDEDEDLLARRLVAQRCLYGVDRNPIATDLARLSLWLATLARDHEFTFLDHALKSGDSVIGLTRDQIGALTWGDDRQDSAMSGFVRARVAEAVRARAEIRDAPDAVARAIQEARHRALEARMEDVRALGDAVLACFFGHDKPRTREAARRALAAMPGGGEAMWAEVRRLAATLGHGAHPVLPLHWELEFPEVFEGRYGGFDAIVGNPPFLGGAKIWSSLGSSYPDWLRELHSKSGGKAVDLAAHFFRRSFNLIRVGGAFGLVATNTISQGDTRDAGLKQICRNSGIIYRAARRLPWPGEAAVIVSVVHVGKEVKTYDAYLDGASVKGINSFLFAADSEFDPVRLQSNVGLCFRGCDVYGQGFLFSDQDSDGQTTSISVMRDLIAKNKKNAERIFPFLGGKEIASHPEHLHHRYVINFALLPLDDASKWPDLLEIVKAKVKPVRDKMGGYSVAERRRDTWWQFGTYTPALFAAIDGLDEVIVTPRVSQYPVFTKVKSGAVFSEKAVVFASSSAALYGTLSCRLSETWIRFFTSTMKDDLNYAPSDCFENFPLPHAADANAALRDATLAYNAHRAALMVARNEGLTKVYNRFHNPSEHAPDIQRLRELHHLLDLAVLRTYGWDDLAARAAPEFLTEETEPDHRYQGRLFWPAPFRDEVLALLLDFNRTCAAEERRLGLSPGRVEDAEEEQEEAA